MSDTLAAYDALPVMVWTTDPDGQTDYNNSRRLAFTGRPADQEAGWGWTEPVHPDDRGAVREARRQAASERRGYTAEYRLRRADGEYRWVEDTAVPRPGAGGSFAGLVGVSQDVTDRRQRAQRIRQLQRTEGLAQLAHGVGHDFNNLLTGILGHVSLLLEDPTLSPEARSDVTRIEESADRAAGGQHQRVEQALERLPVDRRAAGPHGEGDERPGPESLPRRSEALVYLQAAGAELEPAPVGKAVAGAGCDLEQHFLQLARVGQDRLEASGERSAAKPESLGGTETILLVEDEEQVRELGRRVLEREGYTVLTATDAESATALADRHAGHIHLLITDVHLPRVSGRELAARLGIHRPAIKVLYVSGTAEGSLARHRMLEPGTTFLEKPFSLDRLLRSVRRALGTPEAAARSG